MHYVWVTDNSIQLIGQKNKPYCTDICCRPESRYLRGRSGHHAFSRNYNVFRYCATDQQHHDTLPRPALLALLRSLAISKLDYCCTVLAGLPETLLHRLQSVLNAAARLVFSASKHMHASTLLRQKEIKRKEK